MRPSEYTVQIGEMICTRLAEGESLVQICRDVGMPNRSTVYRWLRADAAFERIYRIARVDQADSLADEIISIDDDSSEDGSDKDAVARARLKIDARKFLASKLKPKVYGDRTELTGAAGSPLIPTTDPMQIARRIAFLLKKAAPTC